MGWVALSRTRTVFARTLRPSCLVALIAIVTGTHAVADDIVDQFVAAFERHCLLRAREPLPPALRGKVSIGVSYGGPIGPSAPYCVASLLGEADLLEVKALLERSTDLDSQVRSCAIELSDSRGQAESNAYCWRVPGATDSRIILYRNNHTAPGISIQRIDCWQVAGTTRARGRCAKLK